MKIHDIELGTEVNFSTLTDGTERRFSGLIVSNNKQEMQEDDGEKVSTCIVSMAEDIDVDQIETLFVPKEFLVYVWEDLEVEKKGPNLLKLTSTAYGLQFNRRKAERFEVGMDSWARDNEKRFPVFVQDISETGIGLIINNNDIVYIGDTLCVELSNVRRKCKFIEDSQINVKVVRIDRNRNGHIYLAGCEMIKDAQSDEMM